VQVVPVGDVAALRDAIEAALALAERQRGVRDILESARSKLSWAEYGKRYSDEIMRRLEQQE